MAQRRLPRALARAFVTGEQTLPALLARAHHCLGREWPWLRPLAKRYLLRFFRASPTIDDATTYIEASRYYRFARKHFGPELQVVNWITTDQRNRVDRWQLPRLLSVHDLCNWLAIDFAHLEWFADRRHLGSKTRNPKLENYHYRVLAKPGGRIRLIEGPKKTLKELHRRIARDLLALIPAHPSAHGFIRGRSILTFAAPHANKEIVLRLDLQDFFPGVLLARVQSLFRTLGYSESVADYLAALCTNAAPRRLWCRLDFTRAHDLWSTYGRPHLPQGAPTSPAIANLCAYRLDCRLTALARQAGATYTRYADDLAFSGDRDFSRGAQRFALHVAAIALEEGFAVNHRKTRVMRQAVRQHLAGLTVNCHPNLPRDAYDRLKATLTNCVRQGPATQNRSEHPDYRAHLAGRIAFVASIHPQKAARLQKIFDAISW